MSTDIKYKFLDVGCKIGGSFDISKKYGFSLDEGIGIDINEENVKKFNKKGMKAIVADATSIPFSDNSFELVIYSHVLEHMPDKKAGFKSLKEILRVCSKNVVIVLPFFDEDKYLNSLELKTFYSDWKGHTNKVHLSEIKKFLSKYKFEVRMIKEINDSSCPEILPLTASKDSIEYDKKKHGDKPMIRFEKNIWKEYMITLDKTELKPNIFQLLYRKYK